MTALELKNALEQGKAIQLVDVREFEETSIASIGGKHIPLGDLSQRFQELDPEQETVVLCHHGVRSAHAATFLKERGFMNVHNLNGGIEAWSQMVDPSVMRY
jgi:rhodanese-related sulfurtransferase